MQCAYVLLGSDPATPYQGYTDWLGQITPTATPSVAFSDQRILVRVRSFEDPVADRPLTEALQADS